MNITIRDVAKIAGVSPSTVSRTCNDSPAISKETKEKVRKVMKELGYEPNFQASNLASKNSKTIGIILPVSENSIYQNSFFLEIIHGIAQVCNNFQYMNTLISGNSEKEILNIIKSMVKSGKVDGFIVLYSKRDDEIIEYLYREKLPYVLVGKDCSHINQTIYIDNDNILAAKDATNYLINLGHKNIGFITSDNKQIFSQDRKSGYISALLENNLEFIPEFAMEINFNNEKSVTELKQLFLSNKRPTAIVACDDIMALSLEKILSDVNIKIPNQLSIISFNNSLLSKFTNPQLTSIDINTHQLGMEAATRIINRIENPDLVATKIIVPHKIIERESCSKI